MKNINDLKERLKKDKEFKKLFANKRNFSELVEVARENGYDVSEKDLKEDEELSEDALEAVAGGARDKDEVVVHKFNLYS